MVFEETEEQVRRFFPEYGTPLTAVSLFHYLGRIFPSADDDWPVVERNLRRARGKWGRMAKLLVREVADKITTGRFYVAVV